MADEQERCAAALGFATGNATYAGGLAALVVNLVLAAYVVAAFLEDDSDVMPVSKEKSKHVQQQEKKDQ